jgi:hypothetical protein
MFSHTALTLDEGTYQVCGGVQQKKPLAGMTLAQALINAALTTLF